MNGQLLDLWGRWVTNALRGQNQIDIMNEWWLRGMQEMSPFGRSLSMLWGAPVNRSADFLNLGNWQQQMWEALFKMQQLCMQWVQMVPQQKYDQLSERAEELEDKIREQAKTIDRLRKLLTESAGENNVVVSQLQELIGQQTQQFKQMTQNVSDYIKTSAQKVAAKK